MTLTIVCVLILSNMNWCLFALRESIYQPRYLYCITSILLYSSLSYYLISNNNFSFPTSWERKKFSFLNFRILPMLEKVASTHFGIIPHPFCRPNPILFHLGEGLDSPSSHLSTPLRRFVGWKLKELGEKSIILGDLAPFVVKAKAQTEIFLFSLSL